MKRLRNLSIMPKPAEDGYPDRLPDCRNMGILLRILLLVEAGGLVIVWLTTPWGIPAWAAFVAMAPLMQGILLLSLLTLCTLSPWLRRLSYPAGWLSVMLILGLVWYGLVGWLHALTNEISHQGHTLVTVWLIAAAVLEYFRLRDRSLQPALTEARLQALQARIRPHFLFNSLNAVLSLIRSEPARAERALENLAELYRAMLSDIRRMVSMADEIALGREYLELESLRLGPRLQLDWQIDDRALKFSVPPLILQPLLENAVYHGIELLPEGGVIRIIISWQNDELHIQVSNPFIRGNTRSGGNNMALNNIRNRLMLHFDAEASVRKRTQDSWYEVSLVLPARLIHDR